MNSTGAHHRSSSPVPFTDDLQVSSSLMPHWTLHRCYSRMLFDDTLHWYSAIALSTGAFTEALRWDSTTALFTNALH
jgi:hypothetical protein